jgi:multiple sugar transport system ATP-binding protein
MQRVAIGRAIVRRPRLFLMDEPLTNLDAKLREALRIELLELRRSLGIPMLFVTHDQTEALSMADRIVVLAGGRVLQSGPPQRIYEKPESPTVALQLGQPPINLLPVRRADDLWIAADGTPVMPAAPGSAERAVLGLRPEHLTLDGGSHDGVVKVVEYMGATTTLLVHWAGSEIRIVTRGRSAVRPSDVLRPRVDAARVVVFPPS